MNRHDGPATQNDHFRVLYELASEGIWRCELEEPISILLPEDEQIAAFYRHGYFAECNPAMAAMYGVPDASALVGARLGDLLPPEDPHNREYLRAFIRSGYRLTDAESHEVDATGRPKHFINNLFGIVEGEHLVRAWGTQRDITRQKEIEHELRRKVEEKDEFLAMLAHELRNPLAPIRTAARILEMRKGDDPGSGRNLEIIVRSVETMARLLDDLLDVSRITRGLVELRPEPIDLAAAVRQGVEIHRSALDALQHQLTLRIPDKPLPVLADPVRLEQILTNLLTNAAKYTDPGGRITVTLEVEDDDVASSAVLRVRDTGRGIPPELLPRVFDLFTQGEQGLARTHGGLGIGLTMVRRLVEMHGGRVSARSEGPGRGAEFIVRLPLTNDEGGVRKDEGGRMKDESEPRNADTADSQAQETPTLSGDPARGSTSSGQGIPHPSSFILHPSKSRVLIVDDNTDAADTLVELFQLWRCDVKAALDGPAALEMAGSFQPHLILLDIGMPQMDGFEVVRRLRAAEDAREPRPWVIALTGYGRDADRNAALEAGFDDHLTKPVDPEHLRRLLQRLPEFTLPDLTTGEG